MTEIGSSLREARMRARIDIIDVEGATKIRAKYLRALENEEWSLLPGPTFVKTFLRTYAEYLGLDARMFVEEYKERFERPTEVELRPLSAPRTRERDRTRGPIGPPPVSRRALIILGVVVAVFVGFYVLGEWGGTSPEVKSPLAPTATTAAKPAKASKHAAAPKRHRATLRLTPTAPVYVCLTGAKGVRLIPGVQLTPDSPSHTYAATRLLLTIGSSSIKMRVNGKEVALTPSTSPRNYVITPSGRFARPRGKGPNCG